MASVFDDILTTIFGGAETSAQDFQRAANLEARRAIDVSTGQARADVLELFPQADVSRNLGFQAALDVLGQTIPSQLQAFQQGNVAAQQNLLAGLPQARAAILGGQFDPSGFQATELAFDPSFAQQTLPTFPTGAAPRTAAQQQTQGTQALTQLLSGAGGIDGAIDGQPSFLEGREARMARTGEGDISGLLSGISEFLETPEGRIAASIIPGGGIAMLVNEIFGGAGSTSAGQIGTSSEPGIDPRTRSARIQAESRARAGVRGTSQRAAFERDVTSRARSAAERTREAVSSLRDPSTGRVRSARETGSAFARN